MEWFSTRKPKQPRGAPYAKTVEAAPGIFCAEGQEHRVLDKTRDWSQPNYREIATDPQNHYPDVR